MTKGERMATPPWMPPEFGNDAVLIKALGDRINELCHQLEKVEHDRDRYSNRIAELDLLIQTAEDYAKAQDERMGKLVTALEEIAATEWYSEDHCIAEAEEMVRVAKLALKSAKRMELTGAAVAARKDRTVTRRGSVRVERWVRLGSTIFL